MVKAKVCRNCRGLGCRRLFDRKLLFLHPAFEIWTVHAGAGSWRAGRAGVLHVVFGAGLGVVVGCLGGEAWRARARWDLEGLRFRFRI